MKKVNNIQVLNKNSKTTLNRIKVKKQSSNYPNTKKHLTSKHSLK